MNIPVIALGDSIMWGQGLNETNKFSTLVRNRLATYLRGQGIGVDLRSYAHSGAEIRPEEGDSLEPLWGEVPTAAPSIQRQLATAARELAPVAQEPCLVLVTAASTTSP